ncbi:MAG TPA: hypothetical protein VLZ56_03725, partial [Mycoplana sp.]|nr:hypothetical protein [Mycoplana sp.]
TQPYSFRQSARLAVKISSVLQNNHAAPQDCVGQKVKMKGRQRDNSLCGSLSQIDIDQSNECF